MSRFACHLEPTQKHIKGKRSTSWRTEPRVKMKPYTRAREVSSLFVDNCYDHHVFPNHRGRGRGRPSEEKAMCHVSQPVVIANSSSQLCARRQPKCVTVFLFFSGCGQCQLSYTVVVVCLSVCLACCCCFLFSLVLLCCGLIVC